MKDNSSKPKFIHLATAIVFTMLGVVGLTFSASTAIAQQDPSRQMVQTAPANINTGKRVALSRQSDSMQ